MLGPFLNKVTNYGGLLRKYTSGNMLDRQITPKFETVFSLPLIKYIAVINRLKLYHFIGTSIAVPSCGVLEMMNVISEQSFLSASYIGVTGGIVLSAFTYPLCNIIGFLYISEDNQKIKISSMNFWGKRIDKIVPTEDWIPLLDLPSKTTDAFYLSPQLSDGSKYKLLVKFGKVLDAKKMGQVLE